MIDTIALRLYGIHETKTDALSTVQAQSGISSYVVPEHNDLYVKMLNHKGANFSAQVRYNKETESYEEADQFEFLKFENDKKLNYHYQNRQMLRLVDEKKSKDLICSVYGSYKVPSSFSDVAFSVNENGGFIDFRFSIPKYLYGHSLAEFIPQVDSKVHLHYGKKTESFAFQMALLYPRLMKTIEKFLTELCGQFGCDMLPNYDYVEIRRIDICYNQYFESKDQALAYQEQQRKINFLRQKRNSNASQSYTTTIDYKPTSGSYFKIYHKGSEYANSKFGDLRKHLEINQKFIENKIKKAKERIENEDYNQEDLYYSRMNGKDLSSYQLSYQQLQKKSEEGFFWQKYDRNKKAIWNAFEAYGKGKPFDNLKDADPEFKEVYNRVRKKMPYNIQFLKNQMDLVLRYEVSLTAKFFASCYKTKVFRRNCPIHRKFYNEYRETKRIKERKDPGRKLTKFEIENYDMFNRFLGRHVSLMLGNKSSLIIHGKRAGEDYDSENMTYNISKYPYRYTALADKDTAHFNNEFLQECFKHFEENVNHYQLKKIKAEDDLVTRMHDYNEEVENRREAYNQENHNDIYENIVTKKLKRKKNGAYIQKPTELLKQTKLRELKLKKINVTMLYSYVNQMKTQGKSLDQIFKKHKTSASTRTRIKQDLEMFGVNRQTLDHDIDYIPELNFSNYYWKTAGLEYSNKFYCNTKHSKYAQITLNQAKQYFISKN